MGGVDRSRERVEERLAGLEIAYGSFPINQTTVSLPARRFEEARDRIAGRPPDVYVAVSNGHSELLHVTADGERSLPRLRVGYDETLERRAVTELRERIGLECTVDGIRRARIEGVRNDDDPDGTTLYHLVVTLACTKEEGCVADSATWIARRESVR